MIPVYHEEPEAILQFQIYELCIFCNNSTDTWHENTNNPVCIGCAKTHKVSDILEDHGQNIRKMKRLGTFERGSSIKADQSNKVNEIQKNLNILQSNKVK